MVGFTVFALLAAGWSQGATTSLNGRVTDPSGAAVPGARVTLLRPATGQTRSVTTNASGGYQFLALAPGQYRLTVSAHGFATTIQRSLTLLVN
ncbi:MAG: carboxypeptidase-like regulatory domain-containing protein, partial [Terriglobales bacterium]